MKSSKSKSKSNSWSSVLIRAIKFPLPLVVLAVGVAAFMFFKSTAESPQPVRVKNRAPLVSVQVVRKVTASPTIRVFGQVETPRMSQLASGVDADVVEVKVLEGNAVKEGQAMIVMDDTDADLEIAQRQAELAEIEALMESDRVGLQSDQLALATEQSLLTLSQKAVARARQLAKSQVGSEAALDRAMQDAKRQQLMVNQRQKAIDDYAPRRLQLQARRDKAQATLQRAERDRRRTRVVAPFDGRITAVLVSQGDRATRNTPLIRLYDESQLELRAQVPGNQVAALRDALDGKRRVRATADVGGRIIDLFLHRMSANVAQAQGGIDAFFRTRRGKLPVPGSTLEVNLKLPPVEGVVVLPADALYGRDRVYAVRDKKLQARQVRRLGRLNDNGQAMLIIAGDGFRGGEQILNSRLPQAVSGLEVEVAQ